MPSDTDTGATNAGVADGLSGINPATGVIGAVFGGIDMAVTTVAEIVNNHTDRLANNPCAWRNELYLKWDSVNAKVNDAWKLAANMATQGRIARESAIATAGFADVGFKFNPLSITHFGEWLRNRGYVTGVFSPGLGLIPLAWPGIPMPYIFVRHGSPRTASGGLYIDPGVYLYPNNPITGKLAGPVLGTEWAEWVEYMRSSVQPINRLQGPRGGWQGIVAALTGSAEWQPGQAIPSHVPCLISDLRVARAQVQVALNAAKIACQIRESQTGDDDGGGGGGGDIAGPPVLLILGAAYLALQATK